MERDNQPHDDQVDLGTASIETQGAKGGIFELSGLDRQVGISDE